MEKKNSGTPDNQTAEKVVAREESWGQVLCNINFSHFPIFSIKALAVLRASLQYLSHAKDLYSNLLCGVDHKASHLNKPFCF
jgi:hypothetical protein